MNSETEKKILNYQKGKAILIHGPTGCGKTYSIHEFAKKHDFEIIESNASVKRNPEEIEKLIASSKQKSLFGKKKLFFIDELDAFSSRGAIPILIDLIKSSYFPVVIVALDPWKQKFSNLRKYSSLVRIRKPSYLQVRKLLREYCAENNIECAEDVLEIISKESSGDYRAAINDVNTLNKNGKITKDSLKYLGKREREKDVFEVLNSIFKNKGFESHRDLNDLNMDLNGFLSWMTENIPIAYREKEERAEAYYWVSRADQMIKRARKRNEYRFYYYASLMLSAGISLSGDARGYIAFKSPSKIRKLFQTKQKRAIAKSISEKIAKECHISGYRAIREYLPFLKFFEKNTDFFDEKELEFIRAR